MIKYIFVYNPETIARQSEVVHSTDVYDRTFYI